jgi:uncharacterized phage-associated protein
MANVHDVAAYIVGKTGEITAMKLQKLVYYAQAWHAVWSDHALFDEEIQAWANGPVCTALYGKHKGQFRVSTWPYGDAARLDADEADSVDVILDSYGKFTAHQLSEMTHREDPWIEARDGLNDGARSSRPITVGAMVEYYSARTA